MQKITEYKIVGHFSPNGLSEMVNELIQSSWIPTGGIFIVQSPLHESTGQGLVKVETHSYQAMVKMA